ncbi:MAG: 2-C-methyl-D-erythritol 4-phosphate cytidylyltransferase, partial [Chthoniobacterales bacterium]
MLTAIIVAGGSSRRMGFDKTFASLADKPVFAHTVAVFEKASCVEKIIIVGRAERLSELRERLAQERFTKVQHVIPGGTHRQDSVAAGLSALEADCEYVAVHDAARPFVTPERIERVFDAARAHGAAALAAPVTDTLKRSNADHFVSGSIDREGVYTMQTPQIFARGLLEEAYALVTRDQLAITDEVSAFEHLGRAVILVPNDEPNPKITFPADLALAESILASREPAR